MERREFSVWPESEEAAAEQDKAKAELDSGLDDRESGPTDPSAVFNEYFPAGRIEEVDFGELPKEVAERMHGMAKLYLLPEKFDPDEFGPAMMVSHADGGKTYFASYEKDYREAGGGVEESTYLFDVDEGDEYAGFGEIRYSLSSDSGYFKEKPFVGYTVTEEEKSQKGLGLRRMAMMNAISRMAYGQPLYSDTVQSDQAKRLWEALVKQGDAVKFKEGDHDRYVFTE